MAVPGKRPEADPHRGSAAFDGHLPRVLNGRTLEQLGWRRPNPLTLLVPTTARPLESHTDDFMLRLGFEYYPEWPPTASFVNPATFGFDPTQDLYWLPQVVGDSGFAIHATYDNHHYRGQLVCCSFTAEFYLSIHGVQSEHVWNADRYTFGATIHRVERALRSTYYQGRHAPRPTGEKAA
jgi:hypothetical protein